ncbi:MAG: dTDP-4-dehydrorhamnose reductase [Bacteroidales bacterium]|jgi:dTDP-4-dehydrorhamnose reductase
MKDIILITGANGQLGSELKDVLSDKLYDLVFTDVDELDITNQRSVNEFVAKQKPNIIINCAAYTNVDKCETDAENARLLNSDAPKYLALAANNVNAKLIHISTDYVFSGNHYKPLCETDACNPNTVYGKTKLEGEKNVQSLAKQAVIIRTSWLYSSYGNNFVKTMLNLSEKTDTVKVVFDQIGTPTNANDLASAIAEIIKQKEKIVDTQIFHYSNEGVASWYDFTANIYRLRNKKTNLIPVLSAEFPRPAQRPFYSVLDKSKIKQYFNIEIPYWSVSLEKCLKKF